ncbi:MAG: hypothetical protein IPI67_39980 [Myxococcales bacterium]|nr:hypothetical protein [Myxococcales bacterium]
MFQGWSPAETSAAESLDAVFRWLVRLRWVAVLGVAAVLALAGPVLGQLPPDSATGLWSVAALLLAYNAVLAILGPDGRWSWFTHAAVQIAVDCLALAALVHLAGGIENPCLPLFVLHVVNANIVLRRRSASLVLALAIGLVALIILGEGSGILPHHCLFPMGEEGLGGALNYRALAVLGGLVLTLLASSLFTRSLTAKLRQGQRRLLWTIDELNSEKERLADARGAVEIERARLQAIIDCMGDAVTCLDPGGRVLFSNRRARELRQADGLVGEAQTYETLFNTLQNDPASPARSTFERAGRTFEATHSLVRMKRGEPLGLVMVARDITDRVSVEKHLMHEEQMSVVGKLAAAVAHEINNPIGVVSLYSQHALANSAPDSPIYGHLETIRRNADGCRKIVGNLLKLARPRKPERRRVDLRQICRETIESVQPLATNAGVRVQADGHSGDVPIWAEVDAGLLGQAVLNLALNAIEAARDGDEVWIGAHETHDAGASARVIDVRDTGPGMGADQLAQIFQPFFTSKSTGTGLGLSVAENIVRSHAGRIEVDSAIDAGTVFRIVLPASTGGESAAKAGVENKAASVVEASP